MDDLILLISESYKKDAIGNVTVTETATSVWAHLQSVTRAEWADAGQNGLQPQLVAVTPIVNYSGEQIVQIGSGENARRYAVYRTYLASDNDSIELYLERKAGEARGAENPVTGARDRDRKRALGLQRRGRRRYKKSGEGRGKRNGPHVINDISAGYRRVCARLDVQGGI